MGLPAGRLPDPEKGDVVETLHNELGIYPTELYIIYSTYGMCLIGPLIAGVDTVSFSDWETIDRHEVREGEKRGKPREKIVDLAKMMNIINTNR